MFFFSRTIPLLAWIDLDLENTQEFMVRNEKRIIRPVIKEARKDPRREKAGRATTLIAKELQI